jgi:hypothetical protein
LGDPSLAASTASHCEGTASVDGRPTANFEITAAVDEGTTSIADRSTTTFEVTGPTAEGYNPRWATHHEGATCLEAREQNGGLESLANGLTVQPQAPLKAPPATCDFKVPPPQLQQSEPDGHYLASAREERLKRKQIKIDAENIEIVVPTSVGNRSKIDGKDRSGTLSGFAGLPLFAHPPQTFYDLIGITKQENVIIIGW